MFGIRRAIDALHEDVREVRHRLDAHEAKDDEVIARVASAETKLDSISDDFKAIKRWGLGLAGTIIAAIAVAILLQFLGV